MRKILPWISINNEVIEQEKAMISVWDDGFQYGYGFFTTLKVREAVPLFLEHHVKRLETSAKQLSVPLTQNLSSFRRSIAQVITKNDMIEGAIRITITHGIGGQPTTVIHATTIDTAIHTVPVITVPDDRDVYKTIKMTYRVPHMIAMQQAQAEGAQDALFALGTVLIESTYANIYSFNTDNKIITPPITGKALDSISRKILMEQLPITEAEISVDTLQPMVLVTSLSIREVGQINEKELSKNPEFVLQIQNALESAEIQYIAAHK